ncbi:MAG TPA: DUF1840 domain-containing protein [Burkholderiales bacterium]|nr:DUF1840 domain-containing protein [Burkholderiales bacterium]
MLVRFDSDAGGITMLGDVAVKLLQMMGHSGTVPSAILAQDIPAALARLKSALDSPAETDRQSARSNSAGSEDEDKEAPVSLKRRAHPLIELLTRAAEQDCDVTWK